MTFEAIDLLFAEAAKIMHLDKSHDAIRSKLQEHISAQHRKDNAASDSASYYNTPYVRDVFGSEDEGHVVHSKDGKMTMSHYKSDKKNGYTLSKHRSVKNAYVSDEKNADESFVMVLDGKELQVSEARTSSEFSEVLDLQEADAKSKIGKITLISAGEGSSGYYTEKALQQAAKDGVFNESTQMFLNHQTKEERLTRPEGDVTKLAAKLTGKAVYVAGEAGKPGKLVAPIKIYPEYAQFIEARKDDIGVSVRIAAPNSGKTHNGLPMVESMLYALSADFVTKAGRGGKIEELYESFRGNPLKMSDSGNPPQENEMTKEELEAIVKPLQESVAGLTAKLDRVTEQNVNLQASILADESLANSGLSARGKARVKSVVVVNVPMTDGKIDTVKFQESIKAAVTEEKAYLQESGVVTRTAPVVNFLGGGIKLVDEAGKSKSDDAILEEADKATDSAMASIMGKEKSA